MPDYRVELDAYSGPLDLLLFLVRRHEIDLNDIPIGKLTDQYLAYLREIEQINVDLAGEFLVMAATLLEIKSRMLLPPLEPSDADQGRGLEELDPRYELVQQLLAYKRYKDAANELDERRDEWSLRHAHQPADARTLKRAPTDDDDLAADEDAPADDGQAQAVEFDLEDANVLDLCAAFARILETIGQGPSRHEVVDDDTPVALHAEDILDRLQRLTSEAPTDAAAGLTLADIFVGRSSRAEMIGLFLALLDLVNRKQVKIVQDRPKGEIHLTLPTQAEREEAAREVAPDWRDPATGEMQYDWPSVEARLRVERRAERRAERAAAEAEASDQAERGDAEVEDEAPQVDDDEAPA